MFVQSATLLGWFSTGATIQEADLLSYLLFDENFTKPLIELGYADAKAREGELVRFFSDSDSDSDPDPDSDAAG